MKNYFHYRRLGLRPTIAFELAFGARLSHVVLSIASRSLIVCVLVWLLTHTANAAMLKFEESQADQVRYTKALEQHLATCLKPGDNPIWIGGELWFCGATNSGVKK